MSCELHQVLKILDKKGFLYEKDGAIWFKSTLFKDDKDRVIRRSNGEFTYFAFDIAFHRRKFTGHQKGNKMRQELPPPPNYIPKKSLELGKYWPPPWECYPNVLDIGFQWWVGGKGQNYTEEWETYFKFFLNDSQRDEYRKIFVPPNGAWKKLFNNCWFTNAGIQERKNHPEWDYYITFRLISSIGG